MEENYFFVIEDINKNRLPSLQGTWKLYCSEVTPFATPQAVDATRPPSLSDSVLIDQGEFTSDENGGFEYNGGNPIIVDNSFRSFIIDIEAIGYKVGRSSIGLVSMEPPKTVLTNQNYPVVTLTESQYIEGRIFRIKSALENRIYNQ